MLDNLGIYTGRDPAGQTAESTVTTQPGEPGVQPQSNPQQQQPAPVAPPAAPPPSAPPPQHPPPDEKSSDLISDLSKAFAKNIGEAPPPQSAPEPPRADEPPKEKTWRDSEPPPNLAKKAQESWQSFKSKAIADVEARDARIKVLETDLSETRKAAPGVQGELEQVKKQLDAANHVVERVAIERSPLFRAKVTEPEELLRARLGKIVDGTGITASEVQTMMAGDLNAREQILESQGRLTAFRKSQIADLLTRWDQVAEERDKMLSRGKESLAEFVREQQAVEESKRAQFMRESVKIFEDQEALVLPKLEPYQTIQGNEEWNRNTVALRQAARRIFDGSVDRSTLAQVALLAPAAVVYQKLFQGAQARIQELEAQVNKLRGVSPTVRDRGADVPTPGSPSGSQSANGDFVKDLVSKFQKSTGLQ